MMGFDIAAIQRMAEELGLSTTSRSENKIRVKLQDDWVILFENTKDSDTIIGFENNVEWHTHGDVIAATEKVEIEDVPSLVLMKLLEGDLLLVEQKISGKQFKSDRFFCQKTEIVQSLEFIEPGESIQIIRLKK